MRSSNRYEDVDRDATKWGIAAIGFYGERPTISEVLSEVDEPPLVTEDDLVWFAAKCRTWNIHPNTEDEPHWPKGVTR